MILEPSKLNKFFEEPHDLLLELLKNLGKDEKAGMGLIFINNGSLESPLNKSDETKNFLELWDSNVSKVKDSLKSLKYSDNLVCMCMHEYVYVKCA